MNHDPYESPHGLDQSSSTSVAQARLAAGLVFVVSLIVGVIATRYYVERAVAHMPREEVYEALPRDMRAVELTLIGWFLSFLGSLTLSSFAFVVIAYFGRTSAPEDSQSER